MSRRETHTDWLALWSSHGLHGEGWRSARAAVPTRPRLARTVGHGELATEFTCMQEARAGAICRGRAGPQRVRQTNRFSEQPGNSEVIREIDTCVEVREMRCRGCDMLGLRVAAREDRPPTYLHDTPSTGKSSAAEVFTTKVTQTTEGVRRIPDERGAW